MGQSWEAWPFLLNEADRRRDAEAAEYTRRREERASLFPSVDDYQDSVNAGLLLSLAPGGALGPDVLTAADLDLMVAADNSEIPGAVDLT